LSKIIPLYTLLEEIRKRPKMYLGNDCSFSTLFGFIKGYQIGSGSRYSIPNEKNSNKFYVFNSWLKGHIPNLEMTSMGWYGIIKERNPDDDKNAFLEFFSFLEVFKNDKIERTTYKTKPQLLTQHYVDLNNIEQKLEFTIDRIDKLKFEKSKVIWVEYYENSLKVSTDICFNSLEWKNRVENKFQFIS